MSPDHEQVGGAAAFRGSLVPLPTPFLGGEVDDEAFDRLVAFQARSRTDAVVIGGATGEGWSLDIDESVALARRAVEAAANGSDFRMRVHFGLTELDSRRANRIARKLALTGIDGLFLGGPSFVMAGEAEVLRHVETVLDGLPSSIGVALHNEPKRTGADIGPETTRAAVERFPHIVAHCEGIGYPGRARTLARELPVPLIAGDDRMIGPTVRSGAVGALSVVGNLVPAELTRLVRSLREDRFDADERERALAPLIDVLRSGPNPVPVKECLFALGATGPDVRPPLTRMDAEGSENVRQVLERTGLLVRSAPRAH